MLPVLTAEQMREVDSYTIGSLGLPGAVLMESAGRAVAAAMDDYFGHPCFSTPLVVCGKGNNGGDGFVVARWLREHCLPGWPRVVLTGALTDLKGDAALMANAARNFGVEIIELADDLSPLDDLLLEADVVIDALLGSGASGAPRGIIAAVIASINASGLPVVAVDSPSGVEIDNGSTPGVALSAALTVTFGCEKPGHRFYPGLRHCGHVVCADIGFPEEAVRRVGCRLHACESGDFAAALPPRRPDSNKASYGKLLVIGGSTGLTGAPVLSSEAAMAAGAGMVTAAVPQSLNPIFEAKLTEVMTLPLPDDGRGCFAADATDRTAEFITGGMDVVALGPGIGRDAGTVEFIRKLAPKIKVPVVLDADGLNAFAGDAGKLKSFGGPLVLTPHPGEMARLCGKTVKDVVASPLAVAREFAALTGAIILLKGPPTVVAHSSGHAVISSAGTSALAKAGSGDVLTGIIAALLAQGMAPFDAAWCGAYLHGAAGELAAEACGEYSVTATLVIESIAGAIEALAGEI
jgi:NAD(P)H-hydrate epimerase